MERDWSHSERIVELSLVVPCYNEEAILGRTIPPLINELSRVTPSFEIILVNNGSTDHTHEVIESLCKLDSRISSNSLEVNKGYGRGVLAGYDAARGTYVGHIPADGPVSAEDVARLARLAMDKGPGCLITAVRKNRAETSVRRVVSQSYNWIFFLLFGNLSPDINGTPKFAHRIDYAKLALNSTDYFLEPEMMIKAARMGLEVNQVTVESLARPGGVSKVSAHLIFSCLEFVKNLIRFRLNAEIRMSALTRVGAPGEIPHEVND